MPASNKPYTDKAWLYEHYVKRRMKLKDIADLLEQKYNCKVTQQALYNWCEKYDLLKYRGKGRKIGANLRAGKRQTSTGKRPSRAREERLRKMAQQRRKGR